MGTNEWCASNLKSHIDIATRCVCIGGMTSDPNGEWMKQAARNLTDMWNGFLLGKRYLIHDRDPLFTEAVRGLLRDSGVKPLRLPANSPNLNAYAERFVLSIRGECLDRFVPLSERHLRTAVTEYVVHYHNQGLGNELLTPLPTSANDAGPHRVARATWGDLELPLASSASRRLGETASARQNAVSLPAPTL